MQLRKLKKRAVLLVALAAMLCPMGRGQTLAQGATFGTVIPIGGHAADIALDEARGRLYVANFTANRIEVISTADNSRQTPLIVPPQPGTLALSPDGRYLVIGHYSLTPGCVPLSGAVTVLNLESGSRQTFARGFSLPLAIAFGSGNQAVIANSNGFELLDPATGTFTPKPFTIDPLALPVGFNTFPPNILQASAGVPTPSSPLARISELFPVLTQP